MVPPPKHPRSRSPRARRRCPGRRQVLIDFERPPWDWENAEMPSKPDGGISLLRVASTLPNSTSPWELLWSSAFRIAALVAYEAFPNIGHLCGPEGHGGLFRTSSLHQCLPHAALDGSSNEVSGDQRYPSAGRRVFLAAPVVWFWGVSEGQRYMLVREVFSSRLVYVPRVSKS